MSAPAASTSSSSSTEPPSKCPVNHQGFMKATSKNSTNSNETSDALQPENMMPILSQEKQKGQQTTLPIQRSTSTIPKGTEGNWEYPSPQQFYNALQKKGWSTPENEIETIVDIHNWLNDGSWQEILKWETKYHSDCKDPKLMRFQGRPQDLSPKAWFLVKTGLSPKPFDRHDWFVDRNGVEVRYIIDYYSGAEGLKLPEFFVDVRPALDSPTAVFDRTKQFFSEMVEKYL